MLGLPEQELQTVKSCHVGAGKVLSAINSEPSLLLLPLISISPSLKAALVLTGPSLAT